MTDASLNQQTEQDYNDYVRDLTFGERGEARRNVERIGRDDVARYNRLVEKIQAANREAEEARARAAAEETAREAAAAEAKAIAERTKAERTARINTAVSTDPMMGVLVMLAQRVRTLGFVARLTDTDEHFEGLLNAIDRAVQARQ